MEVWLADPTSWLVARCIVAFGRADARDERQCPEYLLEINVDNARFVCFFLSLSLLCSEWQSVLQTMAELSNSDRDVAVNLYNLCRILIRQPIEE